MIQSMSQYCVFETAIGACGLAWSRARFDASATARSPSERSEARLAHRAAKAALPFPPAIKDAIEQVQRYANGGVEDFLSIVLDLTGIDAFEQEVYAAARAIPFGETKSYGELAREIGAPDAARAVGQALGRNPIPIIVPCHRILAKGDRIGGFSAPGGARTKERLLALEGVYVGGTPLWNRLNGPFSSPRNKTGSMSVTILITGFGRFPGAPFNPTGPLAMALAHRRNPTLRRVRRIAHVFPTSYEAVDRELPALLARERPDVLLMFGLAPRRRLIRIETRARNALTGAVPDASGHLPIASLIAPGGRVALPLRAPAQRLVAAVRSAGVPAALSDDAGSYLCNYLCWRATEAAEREGIPRLVAFVHVPNVRVPNPQGNARRPGARRFFRPRSPSLPIRFVDLVRAGEAIMRAALVPAILRR